MKHLLFTLLLLPGLVQAAAFTGIAGDVVISGSLFLDNDAANDGTFSEAAGVGNVAEIRHADGTLLWDNSLTELSLGFSGFTRTALVPGLGGTTQFTSVGGVVNFWENALGTFQVTGDYVADTLAIDNGLSMLSLIGFADALGNVAVGQFSDTSYASNGFLEVVGGSFGTIFDTNNIDLTPAGFSDFTFNISGDNIATGGYDFSGSADLAATAVPEPNILALLGVGLIGMALRLNRRELEPMLGLSS